MPPKQNESKFSPEQDAYMATFYDEWLKVPEEERTQWNKDNASKLMNHELFKDNLPSEEQDTARGTTLTRWEERIRKKFQNHRTQAGTKAAKAALRAGSSTSGTKPPPPSTIFSTAQVTAYNIYGLDKDEAIRLEAKKRAAATGKRPITFYQTVKREMWAELTDEEIAALEARARAKASDVDYNQRVFAENIWDILDELFKSGRLGDIAAVLNLTFKRPDGSIAFSTYSVNAADDAPHIQSMKDFEPWRNQWQEFMEEIWYNPRRNRANVIDISTNPDGIPVMPDVDLGRTPPEAIKDVVLRYIKALWEHCLPGQEFDWGVASRSYDTGRFKLPFSLDGLPGRNIWEFGSLADYFLKIEEDTFVFEQLESKEDEVGFPRPTTDSLDKGKGHKKGDKKKSKGKGKANTSSCN
ncbi:hypothetical protein R3P38DRAFT_3198475 [Favolaschia claudopus]|uniref:Uncharacterized protein n=1 Tax=Favolaschia claudopus TaxID=2862362 RepID=A0AAW0B3C8_9AGAR